MKSVSALVFSCFLFSLTLSAQTVVTDSAGEHMRYFSQRDEELSKSYLSYMSEVAHGGRARKLEKRRQDVINSIREAIREAGRVRPYKGDASLRDAYREYWNVILSIFVEDYHKIVDMEEVAERSYDAMEAYLLTQEKAGEKADRANENLKTIYRAFAATNNITLQQGQETRLTRKLNKTGAVSKYMNQVYLISFKSSVQENEMIAALNRNDVSGIEQYRNSMLKFAEEGLSRLDTLKPFQGDGSYANVTRKLLEFHKYEAAKIQVMIDFLLKSEELNKIKAAYEAKPVAKRKKEDLEAFNNAISNFNNAVNEYNQVNNELNNLRTRAREDLENSRKRFMDRHIPRA